MAAMQKIMIMAMVKIGGKRWTAVASGTEGLALAENGKRPAGAGQPGTGIPEKASGQDRD